MLLEAFDSNWIAPLGPRRRRLRGGVRRAGSASANAVALSSGTAALHLALLLVGVGPGDEVLVPSFTFVATANAVVYLGATPVFVDCDARHLDHRPRPGGRGARPPGRGRATAGRRGHRRPLRPVVRLRPAAGRLRPPRGAADRGRRRGAGRHLPGRPAGSFGRMGVFSFNGNKIITTSGGGMLVTGSADEADRARYLATQAREPFPHYEHTTIGYNYRLSNLLAALGRAQLAGLDSRIARRRAINARYREALRRPPRRRLHARRRLRRAQLLAHLHHRRPRAVRHRPRDDPAGARGARHRGPARPGSRSTCSRCSPATRCSAARCAPRIFDRRPVPAHRVGAVRRTTRTGSSGSSGGWPGVGRLTPPGTGNYHSIPWHIQPTVQHRALRSPACKATGPGRCSLRATETS